MPSPTRVCVGEITTAHGIRGGVKVRSFCEDEALLNGVLFIDESSDKTLTLKLSKPTNKIWLAEVQGITDRTAAERLRGTKLYRARDDLPVIKETGTYYHIDLIGLHAVDAGGTTQGTVIAVQNFGAGDLLEIRPPAGETFYLPFASETVLNVDIEGGTVTIAIPEAVE